MGSSNERWCREVSIAIADLAKSLDRLIRGDLGSLGAIVSAEHTEVLKAAEALGTPLVIPRTAAISVLRGLVDGTCSPEMAQAWASFVRRGYVTGGADGPIRPVAIDFEEAFEDAISAAVSRLDEIGDLIDGEVTADEALNLLQLLGEP